MANEYETRESPLRDEGNAPNAPPVAVPPEPVVEMTAPEELPGRTTADGTPERISVPAHAGRPLTNAEVRGLGSYASQVGAGVTDEQYERLRQRSLAEGGQEPESVELHVHAAPTQPAGTAPGAFYGMSTTYIVGERDIFASSVGQQITSYTLDSAAITADANGDKVVNEGTVLQASGAKVAPRTTGAAVGVLRHRVNARYGDQDIGMVIGGRLNANKLWDNGVFGSVAAGAVTQLNAMGIYLQTFDV